MSNWIIYLLLAVLFLGWVFLPRLGLLARLKNWRAPASASRWKMHSSF